MKSWKTTIMGVILAIMIALQPLSENEIVLKRDWFKFILAIGIAVFGYFSKDHDVSGNEN